MAAPSEYAKIYERYGELAQSGIRDYDFYVHVRADGISPFNACLLLRDYFSANLEYCLKIKTAHEGYSNAEISDRQSLTKPDRGTYCPKCDCNIPMFMSICPETELELRAIEDPAEQQVLWSLENQLEDLLPELLLPEYKEALREARKSVRDGDAA